ncbi:unnamed protein product [Rotaria sp. Silwood1]|nr:unnamed protein product [Rotaria sp. Silwood1]
MMIILLSNWITQKQYEQLSIRPNEVELAHLYYLPKAHKPGTPLRPIVFGLKHPAIKISKFLDELLRPLFDKIASNTTVTSRTEVIKWLHEWSKCNICQDSLLCTMDVRGGAMGSPLTLIIANCYMFFFEQDIVKQIKNSNGLYLRYTDDICITINWPIQHVYKRIDR